MRPPKHHVPWRLRLRRLWCRIVHGDQDWGLPTLSDVRGILREPHFTLEFIGDPTGSTARMEHLTGAEMLAKTSAADAAHIFYEVTREEA